MLRFLALSVASFSFFSPSFSSETPSSDWIKSKVIAKDKPWLSLFLGDFPRSCYEIVRTEQGSFWIDNPNDLIKKTLCQAQAWEPENQAFILKHVKPNTTVLDVGAHIGTHTLLMSKAVGDKGRIVSFECQPKIFRELIYNLALNQRENVKCYFYAAGRSNHELAEISPLEKGNEGATQIRGGTGFFVPYMTIDSLNLDDVSFIKIDAEQTEDAVLDGAIDTIARCKPVMLVEIMGSAKDCSSFEYLRRQNRTIQKIEKMGYKLFQSDHYVDDFYCLPKTQEQSSVEIISGTDLEEFFLSANDLLQEKVEVTFKRDVPSIQKTFFKPCTSDKVVIFDYSLNLDVLSILPQEKLVHFLWKPWKIAASQYELYGKVYTWNDELIDNVKFFKVYPPVLTPMIPDRAAFQEKKLCVLMALSDLTQEEDPLDFRKENMKMVQFFETKPKGELAIYGKDWNERLYRDYAGEMTESFLSQNNIQTLKNYRFSLCFEDRIDLKGYISEKIFACFAAGCVPIYRGSENITSYIPKGCFIDYRKFKNQEDLYQFMRKMSEKEYQGYLTNIQKFLKSEKAQLFSSQRLKKVFVEAVGPAPTSF